MSIWDLLDSLPKRGDVSPEELAARRQGYADLYQGGLLARNSDQEPLSVSTMRSSQDFIPVIGDAIALGEAGQALSRGELAAAGLLGTGALVGLVPGAGPALARPIMAAGRKMADAIPSDAIYAGRSLADGDMRGVLDAITPGRPAQGLGADAVKPSLPAPRNAAEAVAKDVLELRAAGRASEVTDEMMAAADDQYMYFNTPIDMDEASRMARANEILPTDAYHGTTHVFDQFGGGDTRNVEGHFGAGDYFTDSAKDASVNYAGDGPDLTQRITMRAEQIADELGVNYDDPAALAAARAELRGGTDGLIIPARIGGSEVSVAPHTRGAPTTLEMEMPSASQFEADARIELGPDADKWEVYDLAQEMADDAASYTEPEGPLADFFESINRQGYKYGFDAQEALSPVADDFYDGAISASDLDRKLRGGPLMYAEDPKTGGLLGNEILRQAFSDAGYDSIRMSANAQGWNMPIPEGTSHIISSNPTNIRSRYARFDPEFRHLRNLSAGVGGLGLLSQMPPQEEQY